MQGMIPSFFSRGGITVEELDSDDEGERYEEEERKHRYVNSDEPSVEHPDDDDVDNAEGQDKRVSGEGYFDEARGRSVSVQSSRVTYGGVDGVYYTSARTRRSGNDGVMIEEIKEADKTTGQARHKISRGIHDKGHSVTRKLNADGKVDMLQTLHNLNEDELAGFEEAWDGNAKFDVPGWKEFDNRGELKSSARWNAGLLLSSGQPHSFMGTSQATPDERTKKVVRINIE